MLNRSLADKALPRPDESRGEFRRLKDRICSLLLEIIRVVFNPFFVESNATPSTTRRSGATTSFTSLPALPSLSNQSRSTQARSVVGDQFTCCLELIPVSIRLLACGRESDPGCPDDAFPDGCSVDDELLLLIEDIITVEWPIEHVLPVLSCFGDCYLLLGQASQRLLQVCWVCSCVGCVGCVGPLSLAFHFTSYYGDYLLFCFIY